jgi:hypothetical protein
MGRLTAYMMTGQWQMNTYPEYKCEANKKRKGMLLDMNVQWKSNPTNYNGRRLSARCIGPGVISREGLSRENSWGETRS